MNTLASSKCVKRVLLPIAALVGLLFTVACGGSSGGRIPPLGGTFSRASLKGQYVIAQTGTGVNTAGTSADPFSETIVFTADGAGNLNVTVDDFNQDGQFLNPPTLPETGSYIITSDGTGSITVGGSNYALTMIDDGHFYVMQQDSGATSSGYGELQDTTAFTAAPSGAYVFKAHRQSGSSQSGSSRVGGITISGGSISGTEDLLDLGITSNSVAVASSVSMSTPDSSGRGSFTLIDGTAFNYYVVNSGKFHFMANNGSLEIGMAEAQSGTFTLATMAAGTSYVFGSAGDTTVSGAQAIHSGGVFTSDGNGNITAGAVDYVQDTTVNPNLTVSSGTYTLAANGRGTLNLTLSGGTINPQIFWMVNRSRAYFLVNSATAVEDGIYTLQTGTTITSQAAFTMDGIDAGGIKDRVGIFAPSGSGTLRWNQASNSFLPSAGSGQVTTLGTTATYQVGSNGRVTVVVNNVNVTSPGMVFYLSSPNAGVMVEEDSNVGGWFAQQASQ
jgi:hypothetical protein